MIHLLILAVHLLATIAKLVRPGGVRAVVAESLVLKQQLLISSRARRRAPKLNSFDRFLLGLGSLFVPASRIPKLAVILKPRTLLRFHEALKKRNYRCLVSTGGHRRPGPKGHRTNSSTRSSSSSAAIPVLAVPASHSRLRVPLASISTKTLSVGYSRNRPGRKQAPKESRPLDRYRRGRRRSGSSIQLLARRNRRSDRRRRVPTLASTRQEGRSLVRADWTLRPNLTIDPAVTARAPCPCGGSRPRRGRGGPAPDTHRLWRGTTRSRRRRESSPPAAATAPTQGNDLRRAAMRRRGPRRRPVGVLGQAAAPGETAPLAPAHQCRRRSEHAAIPPGRCLATLACHYRSHSCARPSPDRARSPGREAGRRPPATIQTQTAIESDRTPDHTASQRTALSRKPRRSSRQADKPRRRGPMARIARPGNPWPEARARG